MNMIDRLTKVKGANPHPAFVTETLNGFESFEKHKSIDNQAEYDAARIWKLAPPPTFTVYTHEGAAVGHHYTLAHATRLKRMWPYTVAAPDRELVGADFADQGDRIMLAQFGYFSVDLKPHRAKREREALTKRYLEEAYDVAGLDRDQQHKRIASKMEAIKTDGVWAKSTGAYAIACRRLDDFMLRASPAIAQSIAELN